MMLDGHRIIESVAEARGVRRERIAIGVEEFESRIRDLKNGKAAGSDLLKPEAIKYANEETKANL